MALVAGYFGVRHWLYTQFFWKHWKLEVTEYLGIDVEDVDNYPQSVINELIEQRKYEAYVEEKTLAIEREEAKFKEFVIERVVELKELRRMRGLKA